MGQSRRRRWTAVGEALTRTGYSGSVVAELESGDENDLRDVSNRIDNWSLPANVKIRCSSVNSWRTRGALRLELPART
jgi:hypothetical protein